MKAVCICVKWFRMVSPITNFAQACWSCVNDLSGEGEREKWNFWSLRHDFSTGETRTPVLNRSGAIPRNTRGDTPRESLHTRNVWQRSISFGPTSSLSSPPYRHKQIGPHAFFHDRTPKGTQTPSLRDQQSGQHTRDTVRALARRRSDRWAPVASPSRRSCDMLERTHSICLFHARVRTYHELHVVATGDPVLPVGSAGNRVDTPDGSKR